MNFITENKIPVGQWMEAGVDWLTINAAGFFDAISIFLETVIMFLVDKKHIAAVEKLFQVGLGFFG